MTSADPTPTPTRGAPPGEPVVACVTGARSSEEVVRQAARLAGWLQADWYAVHVSQPSPAASASDDASVIPHLTLAEKLGATTETLSGRDVLECVTAYSRRRGARHVVVGAGPEASTLATGLLQARPAFAVHVVATGSEPSRRRRARPRPPSWHDPVVVLAAVGAATGLAELSAPMVAEADLVLMYLVAVAVASIWVHRLWAIVAAVLAVVAFNFFFVPPVGSFAVAHLRYFLTFAVMTVAGVVVSGTATRMRDRAREERERSRRMSVLLDVTRGLTGASTAEQIAELGRRSLSDLARVDVGVLLVSPAGACQVGPPPLFAGVETSMERRTGRTPRSTWETVGSVEVATIETVSGPVGLAAIATGSWARNHATRQVLQAALALLGAAVERLVLDERARTSRLSAEIEQTRSDLLSAVSHDLRTPLGTIKGAATALIDSWGRLDERQRVELLADIDVEADRLERMLANLLDISRLQAADVFVAGDWHAPEDVVGSALRATRAGLEGRDVHTRLPDAVSLVWMDPILVEQALVNLLENAARHAPEGPIQLTVTTTHQGVSFEVADRGPGFAPGEPERWFRRFERAGDAAGTGLGLAITRAVVEVHGGTIEARNIEGGGARVRFELPVGGPAGHVPPTWEDPEEEPDA